MIKIELTRGKFTIIDECDVEKVSSYKWHVTNCSYAATNIYRNGRSVKIILHRLLLSAPDDLHVDHINGDRLDNRRCNIRLATRSQNASNSKRPKTNKSGFKGVYWDKTGSKWRAQIKVNGKKIHLGMFNTPESASEAYIKAAENYFGDFARIS